jgi:hypothetical protein
MSIDATAQNLVTVYCVYAGVSVGLTIWLARTLSKSGEVFLDDVFVDNPRMAPAVNRLLVVGFYLLNLGYAFVTLKAGADTLTPVQAMETLAAKLGALLISLGVIHFGNMYLVHRIRRRSQIRLAPPPVKPQMHHPEHATADVGHGFPGTRGAYG